MKFSVQVRLSNDFKALLDNTLLEDILQSFFYGTVVHESKEVGAEIPVTGVNGSVLAIIVGAMIGVVFLFCLGRKAMGYRNASLSRLVLYSC